MALQVWEGGSRGGTAFLNLLSSGLGQTAFGIRKVLKTGGHHPRPETERLSTRGRHVLEKVPDRSVAGGFQEGENEESLGDPVPILKPTEI